MKVQESMFHVEPADGVNLVDLTMLEHDFRLIDSIQRAAAEQARAAHLYPPPPSPPPCLSMITRNSNSRAMRATCWLRKCRVSGAGTGTRADALNRTRLIYHSTTSIILLALALAPP